MMLYKTYDKKSKKVLYRSRPLLLKPQQAYTRPAMGKAWWATTTTVWRVDEIIRRSVRDWRRLTNETGHTGTRALTMRHEHDSAYTGTSSVFPVPLVEWVLLRYGEPGGSILDAFAGGPPRAVVAALMGFKYTGYEIRQEQIDENLKILSDLDLSDSVRYVLSDGRFLAGDNGPVNTQFDLALTCPPYWNLEQYSELPQDLSNAASYAEFHAGMAFCAISHYPLMKPGAFVCIVVGPFRNKRTGELIDFPGHTIENFREAGFIYYQQIVLSKNFASAAKRSTTAWRNKKLVPTHEFLLVFRKPQNKGSTNETKATS